jgi:GT2 family glycosyltransferase
MTRVATVQIVVVNWNAGAMLRQCLDSIVTSGDGWAVPRIVVVDNASSDGSIDRLDELPLPLAIVKNTVNEGFGAASNRGARGAQTDYLLFLNPDVRLEADSVATPVRFLEDPRHQDVGIVGIQLRGDDGHVARTTSRFPTPGVFAARMLGLDVLFPSRFPSLFLVEWDHAESVQLDHVIGAFFLVRRAVFERLGGFDERFFVYLEDLDFSLRARQAGWLTHYLADSYAHHTGGGTSRRVKAARLAYSLHSRILYGHKHFGMIPATLLTLGTLLVEPFTRLARAAGRGSPGEVRDTCLGYVQLWSRLLGLKRGQPS